MRTMLILCVAAAACGKGGSSDWTKRAVKPVAASADGVEFTIDLPEGMRQKADHGSVEFDFLEGEYVKTPNITIGTAGFAKTIEDYVKQESSSGTDNWIRKEALPDGGYIATNENHNYKGKEDYIVY